MKRVAILGCGPAGLLAAHAAALEGCEFTIFSKKRVSPLYGCQYLHAPVPGLETTVPEHGMEVSYELVGGTPDEYRHKVYGPEYSGEVSPSSLDRNHLAWDIRATYALLWALYWGNIQDTRISSEEQCRRDCRLDRFDLVLSTVPRRLWFREGDVFKTQTIWAMGDSPEQRTPFTTEREFQAICNADSEVSWYRMCRVFGHTTIEWPGHIRKPPFEGVAQVLKPITCQSAGGQDFVHLGRYGAWQKGVLSHHAFEGAKAAIHK